MPKASSKKEYGMSSNKMEIIFNMNNLKEDFAANMKIYQEHKEIWEELSLPHPVQILLWNMSKGKERNNNWPSSAAPSVVCPEPL